MKSGGGKKIDFKKIKFKSSYLLIVLGLAAGVLLIVLSVIFGNEEGEKNSDNVYINLSRSDTETYIQSQEKKLTDMINKINGLSDASVMITLDSSSEYIYATKQQVRENESKSGNTETRSTDVQKEIILYEDVKNAESPILVKEIQPKIKGVAVVCKGINDAETELKLIRLIVAVLNVPTNRICVLNSN